MIISNKNTIENNIKRLNEFFDFLSPSKQFLQSEKLFNLESVLKNTLTGIIYNQSWEVMSNFNNRSMNSYFKQWVNDVDCIETVKEAFQPNIPLLIVPIEYKDFIPSILTVSKTTELEDNIFEKGKQNYIDFAYQNAEYHYATYEFLNYMFDRLMDDIASSKYHTIDWGDLHRNYFRKQSKFYKDRLIKFGLLSSNESINERAKMILTSTELLYCVKSYIEPHHCTVRITSEYFVHGGDELDRSCSMIASTHITTLRGEIREIHNPLFKKYIGIMNNHEQFKWLL